MTSTSTQMLLISAVRACAPRLTRALHAVGHTNIHPRHGSVFMHMDREGALVRTLSERAGIGVIGDCSRQMEIELQRTLGNAAYHDLRQALQRLTDRAASSGSASNSAGQLSHENVTA
jgi:hypothetical protein